MKVADGQLMRLLTLNISGPAPERAARLMGFLDELDPDVMVLTETRGARGTQLLLDAYRQRGYTVMAPAEQAVGERGVAIIHRVPSQTIGFAFSPPDLSFRLLVTSIGEVNPLALVGVYVPSRDASLHKRERKRRFLSQMINLLDELCRAQDVILMGDLNVVGRDHVPRYSSFLRWEYDAMVSIRNCGLDEAFEHLHPGEPAYSWVGRTGDGYRYDYAFLSHSLLPRLRACEYVTEPRMRGLTDHSGLLLSIATKESRPGSMLRRQAVDSADHALAV